MAVNPPYEGAVLVLGTMDEIGVDLLAKADDPQDVVAYAGYGFWVPKALATKTKGATAEKDVEVGPIAPVTGDQAIDIPTLDGEPADPTPQGDGSNEIETPVSEPVETVDPTAEAVGTQPSKVADETPADNTAAADPADATEPTPGA